MHTHVHTHTNTHTKQTGLVSGAGVCFDSNISLRDKSERELDFLLLGVRTAGRIYLHTGPVVCPSVCVCVCKRVSAPCFGGMVSGEGWHYDDHLIRALITAVCLSLCTVTDATVGAGKRSDSSPSSRQGAICMCVFRQNAQSCANSLPLTLVAIFHRQIEDSHLPVRKNNTFKPQREKPPSCNHN